LLLQKRIVMMNPDRSGTKTMSGDFGSVFLNNFGKNIKDKFTTKEAIATGMDAFTEATNALIGGSKAGKIIQIARDVEATGVAFAIDGKTIDWGDAAGNIAGLAVSIGFTLVAAEGLAFVAGGYAASLIADAAVEALVDTVNTQYPTWPQDIEDGIASFADDAKALARSTYDNVAQASDKVKNGIAEWMDDFANWFEDLIPSFNNALDNQFIRRIDPIILDLDGDGIEFVSATDINIFFDMDGDGRRERTGWVLADDGFLALDANNNGRVDDIEELFGKDGQSGFAELITLDSNRDRVLNASDAQWSRLTVWRDLDQDGVGDAGELTRLSTLGIRSIDLNFTVVNIIAAGNRVHEKSIYTLSNGTTRDIVDGWLSVNGALTAYELSDGVPADIAALPDLRGSGDLVNLRVAASADPALEASLKIFAALTPTGLGAWPELLEDIIYRWADVETVSTTSRGPNFDGRKLAAIEAFLGRDFDRNGLTNPLPETVADLNRAWSQLYQKIGAALLAQGPLAPFIEGTLVVPSTGAVISGLSLSDQVERIAANIADLPLREQAQIVSAFRLLGREIGAQEGLASGAIAAELGDLSRSLGIAAFQAAIDAGTREGQPNITSGTGMHLFGATADTIQVGGLQMVFAGAENDLVQASTDTAAKALDGEAGNDSLYGGDLNDLLVGGAGVDLMVGGLGDDVYRVDHRGDIVLELRDGGADTIVSSVAYNLRDAIEAIVFTGTDAITARGNELDNLMRGAAGRDLLRGFGGNDTIDGAAGADTMEGGEGNDLYILDDAGDLARETRTRDGIDTVQTPFSFALSSLLENLVLTGTGDAAGTGNRGANSLVGNAGANLLDGGGGADTMAGGAGDDTYIVDRSGESVIEDADAGRDTVRSAVSMALAANVENLVLTGMLNINGAGNALANRITGNAGNNALDGGAGADTLEGGAGNDTYTLDAATDVVIEGADDGIDLVRSAFSWTLGANQEALLLTGSLANGGTGNALDNLITGNGSANRISGLEGADTLYGGGAADTIDGGIGHDLLDGGAGADSMAGGVGDDTYVIDDAGDLVLEAASGGRDRIIAAIAYTLGADVEELELSGTAGLRGTGNAAANLLTGGQGADTLDGGLGQDTMWGGRGHDLYFVDSNRDVVDEAGGTGSDRVVSSVSFTLSDGVEHIDLIGTAASANGNALANTMRGNERGNVLTGLDGDDTLDGGLGADTLSGGAGNDRFVVDHARDLIMDIDAAESVDTVETSMSFVLGAQMENLVLTGTGHLAGTGNDLANRLTGNGGNNVLDGGAGADTLVGDAGNDTYLLDHGGDRIVEDSNGGRDTVRSLLSVVLDVNLEDAVLLGDLDIRATGNAGVNRLLGNVGANLLDGGAGADTMEGGAGDDTYVVDMAGDVVLEAAGGGEDIVRSAVAWVLGANLEDLVLTGSAAIAGTGNTLDNMLTGNGAANFLSGLDGQDSLSGGSGNDSLEGGLGNDLLDGGAGNDTMAGGLGDDTYVLSSVTDVVVEALNAGNDTVLVGFGYLMENGIENAVATGTAAVDLQGNGLANLLMGNDSANVLGGGGGADTLIGLGGNDIYEVDNVGDLVFEQGGGGIDLVRSAVAFTLTPNIEHLTLIGTAHVSATGNELGNELTGNAGNNRLAGGLGADRLKGEAGADTFAYRSLAESGTATSTADIILDFFLAQGDRIDVSTLDADAVLAGNQSFSFIGSAAFTGAGQVRAVSQADRQIIAFNVNANLSADMVLVVMGTGAMTDAAFIL
jgi:Ca2+-binding RTX toxin-like protein/gas vesicle protein